MRTETTEFKMTPKQIEYAMTRIGASDREERIAATVADALTTIADDLTRWLGTDRNNMTKLLGRHAPDVVIPEPDRYSYEDLDLGDFRDDVSRMAQDLVSKLRGTKEES